MMRNKIQNGDPQKTESPLKIKVFLWLVDKNVMLIRDVLQRREWQGLSKCVLCSSAVETATHVLMECTFTKSIWMEVTNRYNIQIGCDSPSSI